VSVAFDRAAGYYDESRGLAPAVDWRLPDDVWRAAAAQVRAEFEAAHPADLDTPRSARHAFRFTATRF
jgi:hypothetical protein